MIIKKKMQELGNINIFWKEFKKKGNNNFKYKNSLMKRIIKKWMIWRILI